jgi:hypothetical protein
MVTKNDRTKIDWAGEYHKILGDRYTELVDINKMTQKERYELAEKLTHDLKAAYVDYFEGNGFEEIVRNKLPEESINPETIFWAAVNYIHGKVGKD